MNLNIVVNNKAMENSLISSINLSPSDSSPLKSNLETFTTAIQLNYKDSNAYVNLGLALHDKTYLGEAIKAFKMALSLEDTHANVHIYLGDVLYEQSRIQEAIESYKKAISIDSKNAEGYISLARALLYKYQYKEAYEACDEARKLSPDSADVDICLANIMYNHNQNGKQQEADQTLKRAFSLSSIYGYAHQRLGIDLYEQGDIEEAVKVYTANSKIVSKWMFIAYRFASKSSENSAIVEEGIKVCNLAIEANCMKKSCIFHSRIYFQ